MADREDEVVDLFFVGGGCKAAGDFGGVEGVSVRCILG